MSLVVAWNMLWIKTYVDVHDRRLTNLTNIRTGSYSSQMQEKQMTENFMKLGQQRMMQPAGACIKSQ